MSNTMIFDPCTFTMDVPKEFNSFDKESTVHTSKYSVGSTT